MNPNKMKSQLATSKSQRKTTATTTTTKMTRKPSKSMVMLANVKIIPQIVVILWLFLLSGQFTSLFVTQNNEGLTSRGVECYTSKLNHKHHHHDHHFRQQRNYDRDKQDYNGGNSGAKLVNVAEISPNVSGNDNDGDQVISSGSGSVSGEQDVDVITNRKSLDFESEKDHEDSRSENRISEEVDSEVVTVTATATTDTSSSSTSIESNLPKSRHHKDYWCHVDCNPFRHQHKEKANLVCGSNGKLYNGLCDLKQDACRQNLNSIRVVNHSNCLRKLESLQKSNHQQNLRIVELKRRCGSAEYQEMKLELLRQFNGDLKTMFEYLDSNSDGHLEAHELWPRRGGESEPSRLLYAQVWSDHLAECPSRELPERIESGESSSLWQHNKKCWYQLDFAFEPFLAGNPCSLSHLLLFDLKQSHQSDFGKFNFNTFSDAFKMLIPHQAASSVLTSESKINPANETLTHNSRVHLGLGDSFELSCLKELLETERDLVDSNGELDVETKCLWTRYNLNLASLTRDPHLSVQRSSIENNVDLKLHIRDAQLYLSGQYKCTCHFRESIQKFVHIYTVQVSAPPKVSVRPEAQWSLPGSRVSFECQHDYIDTSMPSETSRQDNRYKTRKQQRETEATATTRGKLHNNAIQMLTGEMERNQFGSESQIIWLKDSREKVVDGKEFGDSKLGLHESEDKHKSHSAPSYPNPSDEDSFYSGVDEPSAGDSSSPITTNTLAISQTSARSSITMASSRLAIENLKSSDTGSFACTVREVLRDYDDTGNGRENATSVHGVRDELNVGSNSGTLLVQDQPPDSMSEHRKKLLWMFNDNGIHIYRLQNDDGSNEMELVKEINGHSQVNSEVDGNWNQLTLCGGLNQEQAVICEWSDNAIYIEVPVLGGGSESSKQATRKYVYVGQPNLNRVLVIDGLEFEIVAIINTEPQPRKIFPYKPNKIHLSKWVRRRLSPAANARWLDAIGTHAYPLDETPANSRLYSVKTASGSSRSRRSNWERSESNRELRTSSDKLHLIQHDLWLLCYGQPLVLDPSGDEHLDDIYGLKSFDGSDQQPARKTNRSRRLAVQPFQPRLSSGGGRPNSFGWPSLWPTSPNAKLSAHPSLVMINREAQLRNRKSIHIIQSTFFPKVLANDITHGSHQHYNEEQQVSNQSNKIKNETNVAKFKKSTTITTHHVLSSFEPKSMESPAGSMFAPSFPMLQNQRRGMRNAYISRHLTPGSGMETTKLRQQMAQQAPQIDLIQNLYIPMEPYPLTREVGPVGKESSSSKHKIHYAYISNYQEGRLRRVSMDNYRLDKDIELENCDPIDLVVTAQGHLIVQCREPSMNIDGNLIGQLVLDQVTNSRVEFNANVRAHQAYLSPDHRYLISINNGNRIYANSGSNNETESESQERSEQSIVYVQMVTISGLRLQYEIKTSLELSQCSFVWKDGYYAAIIVSINRREKQSEILNLRLADGRLELMSRVPGLTNWPAHREQFLVTPALRIATVSTNQGVFIVDLEDNRVSGSIINHRQTQPPTLLWT